jgi:cellulose synthase (UDP-forming)
MTGGESRALASMTASPAADGRASVRVGSIWLLRSLILASLITLAYYYSWWFSGDRVRFILLIPMALWTLAQLVGDWALYLASGNRRRAPAPAGDHTPTIDVFVTVYNEPYTLIERSLRAAYEMKGVHATWLLDDGDDSRLELLAATLGAGYLARGGHQDAKAGNINAALDKTDAEIVAIFDADHAPAPDFLERTIGYFADPCVGFVQVMLSFCNGRESWVAAAAVESSLDFYNPTATGADRIGGATLVGSNALIRRTALVSCGGYHPGLAEDLATSLALHAAGWQSAYVAEPLAPGFTPPDLGAWFTQQLKWARGVFEVLLRDYPRHFRRLSWGQRLSYAVRMTYYWLGPVVGIHLLFTVSVLLFPNVVRPATYQSYLAHVAPLAVATLLTRHIALRVTRHPIIPATSFIRAMTLVYGTWPVYTIAWIMSLLRRPLAFRPTPKSPSGRESVRWWLAAHLLTVLILLACLDHFLQSMTGAHPAVIVCYAIAQCIPAIILCFPVRSGARRAHELVGGEIPQAITAPLYD